MASHPDFVEYSKRPGIAARSLHCCVVRFFGGHRGCAPCQRPALGRRMACKSYTKPVLVTPVDRRFSAG